MRSLSLEIKARCPDPSRARSILRAHGARFKGLDRQVDTYFNVPSGRPAARGGAHLQKAGRLKLREGNIENALIYYRRQDRKNSKKCHSMLFPCPRGASLKRVLAQALGVRCVVNKVREIYFIKNTKFHIDRVKGLGSFVEIEVFERQELRGEKDLKRQCESYRALLGIRAADLVANSYSDLMFGPRRGR